MSKRAEEEKRLAAENAAALAEDGTTVGLGTGTTVAYLLPALAARRLDIRCVATSPATAATATSLGMRVGLPSVHSGKGPTPEQLGGAKPPGNGSSSPGWCSGASTTMG